MVSMKTSVSRTRKRRTNDSLTGSSWRYSDSQRFHPRLRVGLTEFLDLLGVVEQVHRPALVIGQRRLARIDAEDVVERGQHVLRRVVPTLRPFAAGGGGADDLAHLETAADHHAEA